jgi:hypothetical protein
MSFVVRMVRLMSSMHQSRLVGRNGEGTGALGIAKEGGSILCLRNLSIIVGGGFLVSYLMDKDLMTIVTHEQSTHVLRQVRTGWELLCCAGGDALLMSTMALTVVVFIALNISQRIINWSFSKFRKALTRDTDRCGNSSRVSSLKVSCSSGAIFVWA